MKKKIAAVMTLPLLAIVGGIGFYGLKMRETQTELNASVERFKNSKRAVVDFAVKTPADTPKDQLIYLSGSAPTLGNWDSAGLILERKDDGLWHGSAEVQTATSYAYKVTRGTWGTVETDQKGADLPNRSLEVADNGRVDVSVAEWIDHGQTVPGRVTITGHVQVIKKFPSKILNIDRTLVVWLPPAYEENTDVRYPVLYAQDGQNLFDESTSFAGTEWGMDEAAQKLIANSEVTPFIVVGIYNTPDRTAEYMPPSMASKSRADQYVQFLVTELKPHIDRTFRTQPDRAHTAIAGGALGGTIAMYAAQKQADVFGTVIALSPWLRQGDQKFLATWPGDGKWLKTTRVYADMGDAPGPDNYPGKPADAAEDAKALAGAFSAAGLEAGKDFAFQIVPNGKHDETSWHAEIENVLRWAFAKQ